VCVYVCECAAKMPCQRSPTKKDIADCSVCTLHCKITEETNSLKAITVVGVLVGTAANEDGVRLNINGTLLDGR